MNGRLQTAILFSVWVLVAAAGRSDETPAAPSADSPGMQLFESKIRPLLVKHCYQCHSAATGQPESGLLVDSREGLRQGGDRGPAVVPGKPDESLLLTALSHADSDLQMPPKKERLPASLIRDVEQWIRLGAPDPREKTSAPPTGVDVEAGRRYWSFVKPRLPAVPVPREAAWAANDIDRFVLARLEAAGLKPAADARPTVLLRRLYFDLIGLPPSPADLQRFTDRSAALGPAAAWEAEVDSLLSSPDFGERWGRHWLDVARFAESSGKEANISFPYAFRYRNYVIDAFTNDLPYDRFLVEQIAGDLLPYESPAERARLLIATGFLAVGPKNLDEADARQFAADVVDEQIDAVSRAVMANTIACARCHDHKFDPYSMEDYYALAGIFTSTKTFFGTWVSPANRIGGDPLALPPDAGQPVFHPGIPAQKVQQLKDQLAALKKEHEDGMAAVVKAVAEGKDPEGIFTLRDALRIFWQSGSIEGQLEKVDDQGQPLALTMGVLESDKIDDAPLFERGDIARPGAKVARRFPRVIELPDVAGVPEDRSGRLELARWLTHPDHPLTARVMVNRVWHYLLGAGLVQSVDNFGLTGDKPSHPELLDFLAVQFVRDGWSVKKLVREIVLSRTYREASTYDEKSFQADPENRLLWRAAKRRIDAEAIRDAMLAIAGDLDKSRPDGSLVAAVIGDRPISLIGLDTRIPADLDGSVHRSIYLPALRDRLPDVLDLFDGAEPSLVTGARETTNVPVQALYLMNSPFVLARAKSLAARLRREAADDSARVDRAYQLCFSRPATDEEREMAQEYLARARELVGDNDEQQAQVWASYCQALFSTAEFRNLD